MKKNHDRRVAKRKEPDCAPPPGPPGSGRYGPKCSICGDLEPFHVHDGKKRIDDYFTVGRGMTDLIAARLWKDRAMDAERRLREVRGECGTPIRTDSATDCLYNAVQNYVEKHGGKLVVVGGIEIQEWPTDPAFCFRLAVKCLGREPKKP